MSSFSFQEESIETDVVGFPFESIVSIDPESSEIPLINEVEVHEQPQQFPEEYSNFSFDAEKSTSVIIPQGVPEKLETCELGSEVHSSSKLTVTIPLEKNIQFTEDDDGDLSGESDEPIEPAVSDWKLNQEVQVSVVLNKLKMDVEIPIRKTELPESRPKPNNVNKSVRKAEKTQRDVTPSTSTANQSPLSATLDSNSDFRQIIDELYKLFAWCKRGPDCSICWKYLIDLRVLLDQAREVHEANFIPQPSVFDSKPQPKPKASTSAAGSSRSETQPHIQSQNPNHNFSLRARKRMNYNYNTDSDSESEDSDSNSDSDSEFFKAITNIEKEFISGPNKFEFGEEPEIQFAPNIVKVEPTTKSEDVDPDTVFPHCSIVYGDTTVQEGVGSERYYYDPDPDFDPGTDLETVPEDNERPQTKEAEAPPKKKRHRRPERKRITTCRICKHKYSHYKGLVRHLRRAHVDEKRKSCKVCDEKFETTTQLFRHVQRAHQDDNIYICLICDKDFPYRAERNDHMREAHPGVKPFNCEVCGMRFEFKNLLDQHFRVHTGEKPHECEYCGKRFTTKFILNIHTRRHTGETPFSCLVCDDAFVSEGKLAAHMRNHTGEGKPHKCDQCEKSYDTISLLRVHLRSHTGEKPFMCAECSKCFASNSNLRNHMLTHSEKEIICEICTKLFRTKSKLKEHLLVHSGEKPHMCEQCGKCYKAAYQLTLHTRVVHLGMQRPPRKRKSQAKVRRPVEECPPIQGVHYSSEQQQQQPTFDYGQYFFAPNV